MGFTLDKLIAATLAFATFVVLATTLVIIGSAPAHAALLIAAG